MAKNIENPRRRETLHNPRYAPPSSLISYPTYITVLIPVHQESWDHKRLSTHPLILLLQCSTISHLYLSPLSLSSFITAPQESWDHKRLFMDHWTQRIGSKNNKTCASCVYNQTAERTTDLDSREGNPCQPVTTRALCDANQTERVTAPAKQQPQSVRSFNRPSQILSIQSQSIQSQSNL